MSPDLAMADDDGTAAVVQVDPPEVVQEPEPITVSIPKRNRRKRSRAQSLFYASGRRPPSSFTTVSVAPSYDIRLGTGQVSHWYRANEGYFQRWRRSSNSANPAAVIQKVDILRYTEEEYINFCQNESWTKEETDLLLDLIEQYDRRFVIVADRMQPSRSVEEIKQRFYEIQAALVKSRDLDPDENPLTTEPYDGAQERTRREQLELLLKRTQQEEKEVAQLVVENFKLEQTIRSRKQELSEARRLAKVQKAIHKMSNAVAEGAVKRRSTRPPTEEEQRQNPFSGLPDHVVIGNAFPIRPSGVYLRHQQLLSVPTLVNQRLQKQLETELEEAGLTIQQLPTPTAAVCDMFDRLRQDYLTYFNLQRYVARKEQDTLQLKQDLQAAQKAAGITPSGSSKSKKKPAPTGSSSIKKVVATKAPASRQNSLVPNSGVSSMEVDSASTPQPPPLSKAPVEFR